MPTPAQFAATVATAIGAELTAQSVTHARMGSDILTANMPVPEDTVRFQLQSYTLPQSTNPDSEALYFPAVLVVFLIHYKLATTERAWTDTGPMQPLLQTFTTPAWWRALAGYHHLDEPPVGSDVARIGNVVSFTVTATVTIDPP
jgi:hypothetical protein